MAENHMSRQRSNQRFVLLCFYFKVNINLTYADKFHQLDLKISKIFCYENILTRMPRFQSTFVPSLSPAPSRNMFFPQLQYRFYSCVCVIPENSLSF